MIQENNNEAATGNVSPMKKNSLHKPSGISDTTTVNQFGLKSVKPSTTVKTQLQM